MAKDWVLLVNAAVAVAFGARSLPQISGYTVQKGDCGYPVCDTVEPGPTPGNNLTVFAQVLVFCFSIQQLAFSDVKCQPCRSWCRCAIRRLVVKASIVMVG